MKITIEASKVYTEPNQRNLRSICKPNNIMLYVCCECNHSHSIIKNVPLIIN